MWRLFVDGSFFAPLAVHAVAAHVRRRRCCRRRGVALGRVGARSPRRRRPRPDLGPPAGRHDRSASPPATRSPPPATELDEAWRTFGDVRAPAPVLARLPARRRRRAVGRRVAGRPRRLPAVDVVRGAHPVGHPVRRSPRSSPPTAAGALAAALLARRRPGLRARCTGRRRQHGSPSWLGSDARVGTASLVKVGAGLGVVAVAVGWRARPPPARRRRRPRSSPSAPERRRRLRARRSARSSRSAAASSSSPRSSCSPSRRRSGPTGASPPSTSSTATCGRRRGSFGERRRRPRRRRRRRLPDRRGHPGASTIRGLAAIWLPAAFEAAEHRRRRRRGPLGRRSPRRSSSSTDARRPPTASPTRSSPACRLDRPPPWPPAPAARCPTTSPSATSTCPPTSPAAVAEPAAADRGRRRRRPTHQALALQDSFRDGSFTYSLDAPAGHSDTAIEDVPLRDPDRLLRAVRRHLRGHGPGRRAAGPGRRRLHPRRPRPGRPRRATSCGASTPTPGPRCGSPASAGSAFEPTPGRGAPGAEDYTGVAGVSRTPPAPSTEPTVVGADPVTPPTDEPVDGEPGDGGTTTSIVPGVVPPGVDGGSTPAPAPRSDSRRRRRRPHRPGPRRRSASPCSRSSRPVPLSPASGPCDAGAAGSGHDRRGARAPSSATRSPSGSGSSASCGAGGRPTAEFSRRLAGELGEPRVRRLGPLLTTAAFDPAGASPQHVQEAEALGERGGRGRRGPHHACWRRIARRRRSPATRAPGPRPVTRAQRRPVGPAHPHPARHRRALTGQPAPSGLLLVGVVAAEAATGPATGVAEGVAEAGRPVELR